MAVARVGSALGTGRHGVPGGVEFGRSPPMCGFPMSRSILHARKAGADGMSSSRDPMHVRRAVLVVAVAAAAVVGSCTRPTPEPVVDDVSAEISSDLDILFDAVDPNRRVRAVLVHHEGRPVLERYTGAVADDYWDVQSVGKSVMSALLGIAIEQGDLEGVDQTLAELLPDHADAMAPGVSAVTLDELLSHTAGFAADLPRIEDEAVWSSPDWVRYVLADAGPDPTVDEPFAYSSAAAHLMAPILVEATGQSVLQYARTELFDPLGISTEPAAEPVAIPVNGTWDPDFLEAYYAADFAWPVDPQGYHIGAGSLRLRPQDLAKLGQAYLDGGQWQGEQVVPSSWVEQSTDAHAEVTKVAFADAYGFMWWLTEYDGSAAFQAMGFGGQVIAVVPDRDLVIVMATELDFRDPMLSTEEIRPDVVAEMIGRYIVPHFDPRST